MRWEVIEYDVCGNAKEGYQVNDAHYTGKLIDLNDPCDTDTILRKLKEIGFLNKNMKHSKFEFEIGETIIFITYTAQVVGGDYPVCELRSRERYR